MQRAPRRRCRGVSGVLIIAVLVMLGSLTTFAVGLVTSVHSGYARELSASRAQQAALAGLDWARFRIANGGAPLICPVTQTLTTLPGTLQPYAVTVCWVLNSYPEAGLTVQLYRITATACNLPAGGNCPNLATPSADYVQFTATAVVER